MYCVDWLIKAFLTTKSLYLNSDDEDLVLTRVLRLVRDVDDVGLLGDGVMLDDRQCFGDRMKTENLNSLLFILLKSFNRL